MIHAMLIYFCIFQSTAPCECRHDQRRRTLRSGISTHGILRGADSICKDGIPLKFLFQFAAPLGVCIEILSPKLIQYHKKLPSPSECRRRGVGKLRQYHDISIDCTMGVLTEVEEYPNPGTSSCMAFLYYLPSIIYGACRDADLWFFRSSVNRIRADA